MDGSDAAPWWRDAVVYQVYPRSFQDSDGDGEGDLRGIAARLDHIRALGADALWLSPVYPSPMADGGYDVADYEDIDPRFGTLADADALIVAAHERGLKLLMDVVPCHTSIEHPWFRAHPERYVWADGDEPPNNWLASFGGRAWSRDAATGRWYLHSFYPEQPDLDWRRADVRAAMGDGAALLAAARRRRLSPRCDRPAAEGPRAARRPAGERGAGAARARRGGHARARPQPQRARHRARARGAARRAPAPARCSSARSTCRRRKLAPYLEHVDCAFAFELLHAPWDAARVPRRDHGRARSAARRPGVAWVLSNHDFPRLPDRVGARNARAAALLALTLPGAVFVYQGDEIGMADGPGADPPHDRAGRDRHRHPMRWDDDAPHGGFTRPRRRRGCRRSRSTGAASRSRRATPDSMLAPLPRSHRRAARARSPG